jgi:dihydrolipoamide dehydrogenase
MSTPHFDVVVIGGGPGGYIAAIRAAQLGFNVACIDEAKNPKGAPALGGTCTNVGCIPSKALLQSSEHYQHAGHAFAEHGIGLKDLSIDVKKMLARKDKIVAQNNDGILYLFKKNKVSFFHGRGSFVKAVDGGWAIAAGSETITGRQIVVATGSSARALPGTPFDEESVLSNDGALRIGAVPKKLGLIGSGVIGLEMGSVWRRLGSEVVVLEALPTFLGAVDEQIAKEAHKAFTRQGLKIELGVKVGEIKTGAQGRRCRLHQRQGRGAQAGGRQAHRQHRPPAEHGGPERRSRRPKAGRAWRHRRGRRLPHQPERRVGGG